MTLIVKKIKPQDCIPLRSLVLRPGQPLAHCSFKEDEFPTSIHMGVLKNDIIICVGSFLQVAHSSFSLAKRPYQLRGMATHPDARGAGAGALLLQYAEIALQKQSCDLIWFNAREKAFQFYEKCGYVELDGIITVGEFGPHKVMYKILH